MKYIITLILAVIGMSVRIAAAVEQSLSLIPQPQEVKWTGKKAILPKDTVPVIKIAAGTIAGNDSPEAYRITITPKRISIDANSDQGVVWARQTLRQLRYQDGTYPQVQIVDAPEFPIRGFMYDDGRNFAGIERIKSYIDLMSAYKLNVFQWHLTDKPAWRIESKAYPRLNDGKFQRPGRDQGMFYTYDEIRDVIEYARLRGITVIPEIDMPGHSDYFQTTFGIPMDSREGMKILEECIDEFCREIPAASCPYIHIGSDEVRINDAEGFMRWSQDVVSRNGRRALVWDPGLPADSLTIRQFWREGRPDKLEYPKGVPFVDSGMGYLNNYDPLLTPFKIYFHPLCGTGTSDQHRLGGILCLWNDVRVADKNLTAIHSGLPGGIMAFSESAWCGGDRATCDIGTYGTIIPPHDDAGMKGFEELQKRMANHKERFLEKEMSYWAPIHASEWQVEITGDSVSREFTAYGDVLDLDALCASHGIPADTPVTCRLSRNIISDTDTVRYFKIGFEAPARSNRNSDGIAEHGKWPNFGEVTVNGVPVAPPLWKEPGAYRYHYHTWARLEEELPYTDEQLYWMRDPIPVTINKGNNTVTLTLRRHFKGQHFQAAFIEAPM